MLFCVNYEFYIILKGFLQINRIKYGYKVDLTVSEIKIYGIFKQPLNVTMDNKLLENFEYDDIKKVIC